MTFTAPLSHIGSWNLKITNDESRIWFRHKRKPWGLMNISSHSRKKKKDLALQIVGKWMQACVLGSNTPGFSYS